MRILAASLLPFALLLGCAGAKPPASRVPTARDAVDRLDATYGKVSGIVGKASIEYLGNQGRVRGSVSLLASGPSSLRFAMKADVIGSVGEIASDGVRFTADDRRASRYVVGDARPCNIAQMTQVPLEVSELVPMLWGMRPSLDGAVTCDRIDWSDSGYYVVMLRQEGRPLAHELHIAPSPIDVQKPWAEQRMRLTGVLGWQREGTQDQLLYRVTMKDHTLTRTAAPIVDPNGLDEDVLPSGPSVEVELPRAIRVEVPSKKSDVVLRYTEAFVNPPLLANAFRIVMVPGLPVVESVCQ